MTVMNISQHWNLLQAKLFPMIEEEFGLLSCKQQEFIRIIDFARVEEWIRDYHGCVGRPQKDRIAIAHAFIAKAVYNIPTTRCLIDRLLCDNVLRRLCGFESRQQVPSEATFSRSFFEFCESGLANHLQDAFIKKYHASRLIGHISRDATAILAREKALSKPQADKDIDVVTQKKKGRPKKGEVRIPPEPKGLEKQVTLTLQEQLANLPKACDIGVKKNSKGFKESWKGYKLHIDTADGDIPISAILTSASVHDSQAALPLSQITAKKITNLYDVMDAAYDAEIIRLNSQTLGHVPLIDRNKRTKESIPFAPHELERYKVRSSAERVNSNLKDNFGGCFIRVRGNAKVFGHLMFALLSITISQTLRLVT